MTIGACVLSLRFLVKEGAKMSTSVSDAWIHVSGNNTYDVKGMEFVTFVLVQRPNIGWQDERMVIWPSLIRSAIVMATGKGGWS